MHSCPYAHCSRRRSGRGVAALPFRAAFRSGLRLYLAGSPMHQAESSSSLFCLWTGRSLPAALHPASRRRSCLPLRTDQYFCPIGTFTLLLVRTLRRTLPRQRRMRPQPRVERSGTLGIRIIVKAALKRAEEVRRVAAEDRRRNPDRLKTDFCILRVAKILPLLRSGAIFL